MKPESIKRSAWWKERIISFSYMKVVKSVHHNFGLVPSDLERRWWGLRQLAEIWGYFPPNQCTPALTEQGQTWCRAGKFGARIWSRWTDFSSGNTGNVGGKPIANHRRQISQSAKMEPFTPSTPWNASNVGCRRIIASGATLRKSGKWEWWG